MEASCVAAAAASVLALAVQVTGFLYGRWDEGGEPASQRLRHELSRLRAILTETEEVASTVPVPMILLELPDVLPEVAQLLHRLKSQLRVPVVGSSEPAVVNWAWLPFDPNRRMPWPLSRQIVKDHLADLQRCISRLQQSVNQVPELSYGRKAMRQTVPAAPTSSALWDKRADYSKAHFDAKSKREGETSDWILAEREYELWVRSDRADNVLRCEGRPGSGKTVIASVVIDDLETLCENTSNSNFGLAYFYFNYRTPASVLGVALALLEQLFDQSWTLATEVVELQTRAAEGKDISLGDVTPALLSLSSRFRKTYIVLDALDECLRDNQPDLEKLLSTLADSRCRLLVLSRPSPILEAVERSPGVVIPIRPKESDIKTFVEAQISRNPRLRVLSDDLTNQIAVELSKAGADHGMFLLASHHLRELLDQTDLSENAVMAKLRALHNTTDEVYNGVLQDIAKQGRYRATLAISVLSSVYRARRPLLAQELVAVVSFLHRPGPDDEIVRDHQTLCRICMGLVIVNPSDGSVSFAHLSVREFLRKYLRTPAHQESALPARDPSMAVVCLSYLLQPGLESSLEDADHLRARVEQFPFYLYAAKTWGLHTPRTYSMATPVLRMLLVLFLDDAQRSQASAQMVFGVEGSSGADDGSALLWRAAQSSGLHLMAHFGLCWLIRRLLRSSRPIGKLRDSLRRTPLHLAAQQGFIECVDELMAHGTCNPNNVDAFGRTALHYGAMSLNAGAAIKRLAAGIDHPQRIHELRDSNRRLPLDIACKNGQKGAVHELLCIADAPEPALASALSAALEGNHLAICQLLLKKGVPLNAEHLSSAVKSGFSAGVQLLVDYGIDVDEVPDDKTPALHAAAAAGKHEILQYLIPFADLQALDSEHRTAAACAIQHGNLQALRTLAMAGADLNITVDGRVSALAFAASQGMNHIVQFLLRAGLNPQSAVSDAIQGGKTSTVDLLFKAGAALSDDSPDVENALQRAEEMGHEAVVEYFVSRGVKPERRRLVFESVKNRDSLVSDSGPEPPRSSGSDIGAVELSAGEDDTKQGPSLLKRDSTQDTSRLSLRRNSASHPPTPRLLLSPPTWPADRPIKVKNDSYSDGPPAFLLLDQPINIGDLSVGTIVASPRRPLDAYCPAQQLDLHNLLRERHLVLSAQNFDMNAVLEKSASRSVRLWLDNARGKNEAVALSAASVVRRSLTNHAKAVEEIIDHFRPEVLELMGGKGGTAYVVVGLMEFSDGTIRRTNKSAREAHGYLSAELDPLGVMGAGASALLKKEERSDYEASYRGEKIFAVQYRVLHYRRSGIFGSSRRIYLEGYLNKSGAKNSGATFM